MTCLTYLDVQSAYLDQLRLTLREPEYVNAPRGQRSRERLGVSFRVADPVQRHVPLPSRRTNIVFNFAEALWYLSGRRDLAFIQYYAPTIARYSPDGVNLAGTAYGPRIFSYGPGRVNQWESVLETLVADPDSKRAAIAIFQPQELTLPDNIDVACTLALQFFIREGALHAHAYMRANDAYRGVVSDIFSFTFLQEMMATQLGLRTGSYTHSVGSFHVYDTDARRAHVVVAGPVTASAGAPSGFPHMPPGDNWPHVREVLRWEERLRKLADTLTIDRLLAAPLPDYWRQVLVLLQLHRDVRLGEPCQLALWDHLLPLYRQLMENRWPDHFAGPGYSSTSTRSALREETA
jgi:thymidylate synthase